MKSLRRQQFLCILSSASIIPSALSFQSRAAFRLGSLSAAAQQQQHLGAENTSRRYMGSIPSEFTKSYHLEGIGKRSQVSLQTDTGHSIQTDVPKKMGGGDTAPQPVETLLAALIGCTQATAVFVGRNMEPRLLIDRLEFNIYAHRDERGALEMPINETPKNAPARLQSVEGSIKVHLKKGSLSDNQLEMLVEQTEVRCPVANMMMASGCEMKIQWLSGDKE